MLHVHLMQPIQINICYLSRGTVLQYIISLNPCCAAVAPTSILDGCDCETTIRKCWFLEKLRGKLFFHARHFVPLVNCLKNLKFPD